MDERLGGSSKLVLSLIGFSTLAGFGCMGKVQSLYHQYQRINPFCSSEIRQEYLSSEVLKSSAHATLYPLILSIGMIGATEAVKRRED